MNFDSIKAGFLKFIKTKGPDILGAIIVIVIGMILLKVALKLYDKVIVKTKLNKSLNAFLRSTIKIAIVVLVVITAANSLGIPTASLVTVLGTVGLAVSLAIKDSLSNVFGGIMVLLTKPFEVGDYIKLDSVEGNVIEIGLIHTRLNTVDNKRIFIPNSQVSNAKIINFTAETMRRLDLTYSISYSDDINKAKDIIYSVVKENKYSVLTPEPIIRVVSHSASSIDISCKVWVMSENYFSLNFDLNEQIKYAFDNAGISIPFNQLDVHVVNQ